MLKAIGWIIKLGLFSILVLVLGNWLKWDGKTINDQMRTHLSHADAVEVGHQLKGMSEKLRDETQQRLAPAPKAQKIAEQKPSATDNEEIPASERQKLRALIKELNSSRKD